MPDAAFESMVKVVELAGEEWRVRFTENVGHSHFEDLRAPALCSAHLVLCCFAVDAPPTLQSLQRRWAPALWSTGSEAPMFVLGLKADKRDINGCACVDEEEAAAMAHKLGSFGYYEASAVHPETVEQTLLEVLLLAKEYYEQQWQLCVDPAFSLPSRMPTAAAPSAHPAWLAHERLNACDDPRALSEETARKSLSMLGRTPCRSHAYLRCDLDGLALTSMDALRPFKHLQTVNVARNHLRSLEPLGALRSLLHLDASHNLLMRADCFAAPDFLETMDLSYNMIYMLGDWGVHKYLRDLNLRGNLISEIGPGFLKNMELRTLDLSENNLTQIQNLDGLHLQTLHLAQNQISTLEGVAKLHCLKLLDVTHNTVTCVDALSAEDIPRLRKLCISENRLTSIAQVEGLASFSYLCDLVLSSNPVAELPHYRAQVLHRLPRLRSLDAQAVSAEEKVKADLIYGTDVDARREIFEEMLPQETFVDRRLVTEMGIAEMEMRQFGAQGEVGPYGSVGQVLSTGRTAFQDAKFRQRLAQARAGGEPAGTADFADFAAPFTNVVITDEDLPAILEASLEGGVQTLLLSGAMLSTASVKEIVAVMGQAFGAIRHCDLTGCKSVGQIGSEVILYFPFKRGCSLEAADCGLTDRQQEQLRNETASREHALKCAADERERTAAMIERYIAKQDALEDYAVENCSRDAPPEPPPPLCHPLKWREDIDTEAQASFKEFSAANTVTQGITGVKCKDGSFKGLGPDQITALKRQRVQMLREWGCIIPEAEQEQEDYGEEEGGATSYVHPLELLEDGRPLPKAFENAFQPVLESDCLLAFMVWCGVDIDQVVEEIRTDREEFEAAWREKQQRCEALTDACRKIYDVGAPCPGMASAQLIAHFTYLCFGGLLPRDCAPKALAHFGLKRLRDSPRPAPRKGTSLHEVLAAGKIVLDACTGESFGTDSLTLRIHNSSSKDCQIAIQQGTIFQHVDWQHRQNLLVAMDYFFVVPSGETVLKSLYAFCMNLSCACSCGNPMSLTEFYFDHAHVLESQGQVWDHFEGCFKRK